VVWWVIFGFVAFMGMFYLYAVWEGRRGSSVRVEEPEAHPAAGGGD